MADYSEGSMTVNTEIDTEGFQKGSEKLKNAISSLSKQVDSIGRQMKTAIARNNVAALEALNQKFSESQTRADALRRKLDALSNVKILSGAYANTLKELNKVDEKFQALIDRQEKMDRMGVSHDSTQWKSLQDDIVKTGEQYDRLREKKEKLESEGKAYKMGSDTAQIQQMNEQLTRTEDHLSRLSTRKDRAFSTIPVMGMVNALWNVSKNALHAAGSLAKLAGHGVLSFLRKLAVNAKNAAVQLMRLSGKAIASGIRRIGSLAASAGKSILGIGRNSKQSQSGLNIGLKALLKYGLGVRSVYMLVRKLRTAISDAFKNMAKKVPEVNKSLSALKSSLDRLKNSLATAFQPILTAVTPYLVKFMDMISAALTRIGEFFAALTGQKYVYRATKAQIDYAKSLDKTKKSAKEAENQLASFDNLNILSDSSKNSDTSTETPTSGFERIPIESDIASFLQRIKDAFSKGDFWGIGVIIAEKINEVFAKIDTLISWENIGAKITKIVNGIADAINGLVSKLHWEKIGRTFGSGVNTIVNTMNLLLTRINFEKIGSGLARGLNGLVQRVNWKNLGTMFGNRINAVFDTLRGFAENFKWGEAGTAFATAVNGLILTVKWAQLGRAIAALINGVLAALKSAVTEFKWGEAGTQFSTAVNEIITKVKWVEIGVTFGRLINNAFAFLRNAAITFKWGEAGENFAKSVNALKNTVNWYTLGDSLNKLLKGAIAMMKAAVWKIEWGDAGKKFGEALNGFFADETLWADAGSTIDGALKGLVDFGQRALNEFKPEQVAKDLKAMFRQVKWDEIASATWQMVKTAFSKAGSFLDVLFSEDNMDEARQRADGSAYWSAFVDSQGSKSLGSKIGEKLAKAINAGIKMLPADEIGDALDTALNNVLDFAVSLVKNFDPDEFREKLEEALGRVDWDAIARKIWLAIKDGFIALAKATPIVGELINKVESELSAEDVASALRTSLGAAMEQVAAYGNVQGGLIGENFFDGFRKKVLDESGHVKEEFRGRMGEMFSESEIAAFESGDMTVVQFYNGLGFGGINAQGEATESLLTIVNGILNAPVEEAETAGENTANTLFSSYIFQALLRQPDAEDAVEGAFNEIMSGIDANGYGDIIAFDYFNSFMGKVMDESGHVKPEFKDVVESMFGSVDVLEEGKVDANDFMRGLVRGMYDSSGQTSVKLIDIIDNVLEKVRTDPDGMDEHSPSRRAAKYGEDFLKGFSGGVDGEEKNTTSAVKSAFTTITDIAFAMLAMNLAVSVGMAAVKSTFETKLGEIEKSTKTTFENIKTNITTALRSINTTVTQNMTQMAATMKTSVTNAQTSVTTGFVNIQNSIYTNLNAAMNRAKTIAWTSVGSNIISGIAAGINNGWSWLHNTVWNLAQSLLRAAKAALGIQSPSKVFRDEVGTMLGLGVAEGMEESQPKILDSVSGVADAMANEMKDTKLVADVGANGGSLDTALSSFSDKVADSFSKLANRLEAIAESVTFRMPDTASGTVVPYSVSANAAGGSTNAQAATEEQTSALIQMFNNQTTAIVRAIEEYCGVEVRIGDEAIGDAAIRDINRRARMTGKSPIMV